MKKLISIIIVLGLIVAGCFYFTTEKKIIFNTIVAKRADIVQEVSVTGRVKSSESVDLAFEKNGKVAQVYVEVGDEVKIGQMLAILEKTDILAQFQQAEAGVENAKAQLTQYQAALEIQNAKLAELKKGAREEEIQGQEIKVANAEIVLENAKKNIVNTLQSAYTTVDDAIRNKADQFFSNPRSSNPQLLFAPNDTQLEIDIERERFLIEEMIKVWRLSLDQLTTESNLVSYAETAKKNFYQIRIFFDQASLAINNLSPSSTLLQSVIDIWKSNVSTARSNINIAINNITVSEEKLNTAKSNLNLEENNLILKNISATKEQLTEQEAQVKQAEANILSQEAQIKQAIANAENHKAQIAKTVIYSPINGVVTKQEAKVGEIISANTSLVSIMSISQFEILANIPEADISKVKIGDIAKVTLDAYNNDMVFDVRVAKINPAEVFIEGIATYKVSFQFMKKNEKVKSGMTANIDILTEKRENVIVIPQRAIITKNGIKMVKILDGEIPKEIKIEVGLRGYDGNIEIISGLKEGDKILQ